MDMKQVWFAGAHSNVGGSYAPDKDGTLLSDNALAWMIKEAKKSGLAIEQYIVTSLNANPLATLHKSRRNIYRIKAKYYRAIAHGKGAVLMHSSVKKRWDQDAKYRPRNLVEYVNENGWPTPFV